MMRKGLLPIILFVAGCTTGEKKALNADDDHMIMSVLESYISYHSNYNTFLIHDSESDYFSEENIPSGYIIGPCYHNQLYHGDYYSYIDVENSRVYIKSSKLKWGKVEGRDNWTNQHPVDSIMIEEESFISKDPWDNNLFRAIFLYKKNDTWFVDNRPDTTFFIKHVETGIHFP